jgi:stage V sporulation protein B
MKFHFKFFSSLEGWTLILVFITIPFMILKTSLYNVFLGIEEVTKYNKIAMLDKLITFALLSVFIVIFRSAQWAIVSTFISTIIMISLVGFNLFVKKGYRIAINKSIIKGMFKYGFKAVMGNLIQNINYRLDVLITATYLTPVAVGLYGKATQLGETMWRVSGSVGTVVFPYTANSKDRHAMTYFINKVIRVTFTFIVICSIGLTIISKPLIVFVLGKKFLGSVTPFMLIIPGICVFSINNILGSYFAGSGLIGKNIIASAISGIITVALDLTLIPRMGINGASITSSISYIVCTGISLYFYVKVTGSKLSDILIIKRSDLIEIKSRLYRLKKVKGA